VSNVAPRASTTETQASCGPVEAKTEIAADSWCTTERDTRPVVNQQKGDRDAKEKKDFRDRNEQKYDEP
jgi:hypothetical protein